MLEFFFNWGTPAYFNDALRRCMQFNMTTCRTDVLFAVLILSYLYLNFTIKKASFVTSDEISSTLLKKSSAWRRKVLKFVCTLFDICKKGNICQKIKKRFVVITTSWKVAISKVALVHKNKRCKIFHRNYRGLFRISKIQYRQLYNFIFRREK